MATKKSKFILVSCTCTKAALPDDILISHIFVRLPARSISHCKCVCRRWNQSLTDPYFLSMQFKHQKIHNPENILCGPAYYRHGLPGVSKEDYRTKFDTFYGRFFSVHLHSTQKAVAFSLPGFSNLRENYKIHEMIGNCDGTVCMQLFDKEQMEKEYLLFGNPSSGVYKLSFQLKPAVCRASIALDMSLYWLDDDINRIIEYDVKRDQFTETPLPSEMPKTKLRLNIVGRSICVTNVCHQTGQVEIWLISKQEEKWSKFLSVNLEEEFGIFSIFPLSFTRDGRVLCDIRYNNRTLFVIIDPKTERLEDLTVIDEFGGDWLAPVEFAFLDRPMLYPCIT